jgi:hypothetical protein
MKTKFHPSVAVSSTEMKILKYASGETSIRFELAAGIYNITITNKSTSEHETKKLIVE